jgi:hypothetical protein
MRRVRCTDLARNCTPSRALFCVQMPIASRDDNVALNNIPALDWSLWWAHKGSNLGPLPCEGDSSLNVCNDLSVLHHESTDSPLAAALLFNWQQVGAARRLAWLCVRVTPSGCRIFPPLGLDQIVSVEFPVTTHPRPPGMAKLEWDNKCRLDGWLSKHLGAIETPYTQSIGRSALIGAVARIRNPGCKLDTVPIIEGRQGLGKSSAARVLFDPWFSDELADLGGKDAAMQTQGMWLIEISELDAMSRSEVSRIKAFISRSTDRFRPPYGSRVIESPRSCVFWGTTNSDAYLKDETGGRRFWPIKAGRIDIDALATARDQLWAEADRLYRAGAAWWIVNPEAQRIADGEQTARYQGDPWDEAIGAHLKTVADVSIAEILHDVLHIDIGRWSQADMNRVMRALKARGMIRIQVRTGDKRAWRYRQPL